MTDSLSLFDPDLRPERVEGRVEPHEFHRSGSGLCLVCGRHEGDTSHAIWTERARVAATASAYRDQAIVAVAEHAPQDWLEDAWAFLQRYLRTHEELHVDDLWDAGLPEPPERRALGPLMLRASRARLIERTGRSRPSVRSHLSEKPVWRSLVYGAET